MEYRTLVDRLVPPGYASTYGYHDPVYPVRGRIPRDLKPAEAGETGGPRPG